MKNNLKKTLIAGLAGSAVIAAGAALAITGVTAAISHVRKLRLKDKVIVISGGGRGLGIVLARKLCGCGSKVIICGRSEETLRKASADLASITDQFLAIPCDITDKQQVKQMIRQVKSEVGAVDILINNAGTIEVGPEDAMREADYNQALNTHFWGPFYLINEVVPDMKSKQSGSIVNIVSIGGKVSFPHLLPYNTSKHALSGYSEGLSAELGKNGISVTTVYPGLMRTGSPRNIEVKGHHEKEYAWFKIADSLPGLSMNAGRAADKIIAALRRKKKVLRLTLPARLAIAAHKIAPGLTISAFNGIAALLPPGGKRTAAKKGYESTSTMSESFLTDKTDDAARRNLEI